MCVCVCVYNYVNFSKAYKVLVSIPPPHNIHFVQSRKQQIPWTIGHYLMITFPDHFHHFFFFYHPHFATMECRHTHTHIHTDVLLTCCGSCMRRARSQCNTRTMTDGKDHAQAPSARREEDIGKREKSITK